MDKLLLISYQSFILLLVSASHNLWEIHQSPSHVVTFGLLMSLLVLGLAGPRMISLNFVLHIVKRKHDSVLLCLVSTDHYEEA